MKIGNLYMILTLFVQCISCNDDLLSKFMQNGYKVKDVRMQLMSYDENFYNIFEVKAFKYNRTTTAHNITFNFKTEVQDKLEVLVQVYKFLSNEYRHFPIRFQVNLKKAFDANVMGLQSVKRCGNVTTCYFHKDITYHNCNFVIDDTRLPPLMPNGKYQVEMRLLYLSKEKAIINLYGEVYIPMDYPKK